MKYLNFNLGYLYILLTVLLTSYGQLVLKWRMNQYEGMPELLIDKVIYFVRLFKDVYILSSFAAAFIASLTWMAALTKFELSFAYPFMSLSFVMVLIASYFLLNEGLSMNKLVGVLLIVTGIVIISYDLK